MTLLRGVIVVTVEEVVRRPMARRSDHEVDVDLGTGHGLQSFLDEARETILEPVLRELARHADAKRAALHRNHRSVLQPHVVSPLRELKAELLLDLRPDLVLVHRASSLERHHSLWIGSVSS